MNTEYPLNQNEDFALHHDFMQLAVDRHEHKWTIVLYDHSPM